MHVLSEEDKSLEDTVKAIEGKESGKIARKAVGVTTSPVKVSLVGDSNPHKRCSCCGRLGHKSDRLSREKECPAYGKKCLKCGKSDHFKAVCRSKNKTKQTGVTEIVKDDAVDVETLTTKEAGIPTMSECEQSMTPQLDIPALGPGEVAGLLYCIGNINNKISSIGKQKVPHMLYEHLKWVIR